MNRTSTWLHVVLMSGLAACGEDSSGSGSTTSASATTTTSTEASTSANTGVGGEGGEGGARGAGGDATATGVASSTGSGGSGGGGQATPESCFAIHEETACFEAGCNIFLFKPEVFAIDDDVCQATDDLALCLLADGGGQSAPAAYVRDFAADGPRVIGLNNSESLIGWTRCTPELAEEVRECCCDRGTGSPCVGVTPLPPRE